MKQKALQTWTALRNTRGKGAKHVMVPDISQMWSSLNNNIARTCIKPFMWIHQMGEQTLVLSFYLPLWSCQKLWQLLLFDGHLMMNKRKESRSYLNTLSEAWLGLEPSQLWCFSWALASFSAAAMGHPDRLKKNKKCQHWHTPRS